tara:strand:- start:181 stop:519 length:339 start_codon:yes stop_codon:yes gene_type:complete
MKIKYIIVNLIVLFFLSACVSNEQWQSQFEAKVNELAKVCGKYRRVAANDEARVGMSEACLMKTKYQYAQINTTTTRYDTNKKFVYLSIQGSFSHIEYVYVEDGIVKRVSKS